MAHLPSKYRTNTKARDFRPGVHLPAWFHDGLKAIDPKFYFVWHPWQTMYDDVMNQYTGEAENPRFSIHKEGVDEIWGFTPTDNKGNPIPENRWHVWRLCEPGWCHMIEVKSDEPEYLKLILDRIYLQATIQAKGPREWRKHMEKEEEERQEKGLAAKHGQFEDIQQANKGMFKVMAENFARGHAAPTRPQKEIIQSGPWSKRSKIVRDLTDAEGGLEVPDDWN